MKHLILLIISGLLSLSPSHPQEKGNKNYFKKEFSFKDISRIEPRFIQFEDTIPNDTIYICFAGNEFPYAYFREIFTTVCSDGLCLPVRLKIYWSPGGDYLGYSLRKNEFLTVLEHTPFTEEDYLRLHLLLDDPRSILRNYELKELVSYTQDTAKIDGISSATIADIENYVVKGAAYTTYTLWKTVYGPTNDSLRNITLDYLSLPLLKNLMYSPHIENNYYALYILNRFEVREIIEILPRLEELINSGSYSLKEKSINSLKTSGISDTLVQETLLHIYKEADWGTKQLVLGTMQSYSFLILNFVEKLIFDLSHESPTIVLNIFKLLENRVQLSLSSKIEIARLLDHDNSFVAKLAYKFLSSLDHNEKIILEKLHQYEEKNL